jgi:hypothetical protein
LPVGGLIIVVFVVVTGGAPGVVLGAVVVLVSFMGVPFRSPLTTAFESDPKNPLKSSLILPMTLLWPWLAAKESIFVASVFNSVAV